MPTIRPEISEDIEAITAVVTAAFGQSDEAELVTTLRAEGLLKMSLVAEYDGRIVGHLAMSPVTVDGESVNGWGLAPMSVDPSYQRRGVGMVLATAAIKQCGEHGVGFVVVLGDPVYYSRFGFEPASQHGLRYDDQSGEAFRVIEFEPGSIPGTGGRVEYAPPFRRLG